MLNYFNGRLIQSFSPLKPCHPTIDCKLTFSFFFFWVQWPHFKRPIYFCHLVCFLKSDGYPVCWNCSIYTWPHNCVCRKQLLFRSSIPTLHADSMEMTSQTATDMHRVLFIISWCQDQRPQQWDAVISTSERI